jgi:coenzyme F420-reducing hydrogenase alpha subunit
MAREAGLGPVCLNPFQSIIVRAVETLYAVEEALAIIEAYEKPDRPAAPAAPRAVTACAATEAPRGLLYHRYRLDDNGVILEAKIVPPTSQNQGTIEADLRQFVGQRLDLPDEKLTWQCEQMVRNYDPCISCATHFLKVNLERR